MNYKLCKELKDAGYPQKEEGKFYTKDKVLIIAYKEHDKLELSYIPTLYELIMECGDKFESLIYMRSKIKTDGLWVATEFDAFGGREPRIGKNKTPEEAVANLYLKLNK